MNKIFERGLLGLLLAAVPGFAAASDDGAPALYIEESRNVAQEFMQRLGGTLKSQLEATGAVGAIGVCKHVAPALAAEYSKGDWVVRRVSLKTRNKALGEPDAWEREILRQFDRRQAEAKPAAAPEASEVTEDADGRWFRYMKAIPVQPMCLQCHGKPEDIPVDVKPALEKEYPKDRATGYSAGDIRGAIAIKRKLQSDE